MLTSCPVDSTVPALLLTPHARIRMRQRGISPRMLERALAQPFCLKELPDGRRAYLIADHVRGIRTWIRVIVAGSRKRPVVVTVYALTSRAG